MVILAAVAAVVMPVVIPVLIIPSHCGLFETLTMLVSVSKTNPASGGTIPISPKLL